MDMIEQGHFLVEEEERRERTEDIAHHDLKTMSGGMHTENVRVGTPLMDISTRWVVVETEKDGNCFYNTMASGAALGGHGCPLQLLSKASVKDCAAKLRRDFAEYVGELLAQDVLVQPYVIEQTGATLRQHIRDTFGESPAEYLNDLYTDKTWSTELDFGIFVHFNKVCLLVFSPGTSSITAIYGNRADPSYYVFANGTHYELLLPYPWFLVAYSHIRFDNSPRRAVVGEFVVERENSRV